MLDSSCEIHGISPFTSVDDAVSQYPANVDYLGDTIKVFTTFDLAPPLLEHALSTNSSAVKHICERNRDLIYIDGSHDSEVVPVEYRHRVGQLKPGGLLVMNDASLGTEFQPLRFPFAGHPAPSRVAAVFAMKGVHFLSAVGHNNAVLKPGGSG